MTVPESEIRRARALLAQRLGLMSSLIGGRTAHQITGGRYVLEARDFAALDLAFRFLTTEEIVGREFDDIMDGEPLNLRELRSVFQAYREIVERARAEGIEHGQ